MLALLDREEADSVRSSVASSTLTVPRNKVMRAPTTLAIPAGCVGLYNLGNSCYMNAAMQALLNWYVLIHSAALVLTAKPTVPGVFPTLRRLYLSTQPPADF